jgi:hypothetical protein
LGRGGRDGIQSGAARCLRSSDGLRGRDDPGLGEAGLDSETGDPAWGLPDLDWRVHDGSDHGEKAPQRPVPSARLTLTRAIQDPFDINISVLRIAPGDVGKACPVSAKPSDPLTTIVTLRERAPCEAVVNAVTIGFGARVQLGRLTVRPFAEFGMGRVRGRYDIGGVYEFVEVAYLPNFKAVEQTGFGGGAGLTLDYVLFPRTILQGLFGYWRFQDAFEGADLPAGFVPAMPASYVGFGLRWGM